MNSVSRVMQERKQFLGERHQQGGQLLLYMPGRLNPNSTVFLSTHFGFYFLSHESGFPTPNFSLSSGKRDRKRVLQNGQWNEPSLLKLCSLEYHPGQYIWENLSLHCRFIMKVSEKSCSEETILSLS